MHLRVFTPAATAGNRNNAAEKFPDFFFDNSPSLGVVSIRPTAAHKPLQAISSIFSSSPAHTDSRKHSTFFVLHVLVSKRARTCFREGFKQEPVAKLPQSQTHQSAAATKTRRSTY